MKKLIFTLCLISLFSTIAISQKIDANKLMTKEVTYESIKNSEGELADSIIDKMDLLTTYCYIINPEKLPSYFENKENIKFMKDECGVRKGHNTNSLFLYMKSPIMDEIPLPIFSYVKREGSMDMKESYRNILWKNLPARENLIGKPDIVADIEMDVTVNNASVDFLKSFTNYAMKITSAALSPSAQSVKELLESASKEINELNSDEKISRVWTVPVTKGVDNKINVYDAVVYQIGWNSDELTKWENAKVSGKLTIGNVTSFLNGLDKKYTYIAFVTTYKSYVVDHSKLHFKRSYLNRASENFQVHVEEDQPSCKKDFELKFLRDFETLLKAKDNFSSFKQDPTDQWSLAKLVKYYSEFSEGYTKFALGAKKEKNKCPLIVEQYAEYYEILRGKFIDLSDKLTPTGQLEFAEALKFANFLEENHSKERIDSLEEQDILKGLDVLQWYDRMSANSSYFNHRSYQRAREIKADYEQRLVEKVKIPDNLKDLEELKAKYMGYSVELVDTLNTRITSLTVKETYLGHIKDAKKIYNLASKAYKAINKIQIGDTTLNLDEKLNVNRLSREFDKIVKTFARIDTVDNLKTGDIKDIGIRLYDEFSSFNERLNDCLKKCKENEQAFPCFDYINLCVDDEIKFPLEGLDKLVSG